MKDFQLFDTEFSNFFKDLLFRASPSGYEDAVSDRIMIYARKYCDEVYNYHGNVVAIKYGHGSKNILLTAHMDEIGFLITSIDEKGMLSFVPIGSVDIGLLPGLRVTIWHNGLHVEGVIGRKAVHLLEEQERMNINPRNLWIDIGCNSRSEAFKYVQKGDFATFSSSIIQGPESLCSRGLDNKVGVLSLCSLMRTIAIEPDMDASLYFAFTIQEEIGCRGMQLIAKHIKADEAYVIDTIHATDYPGIDHIIYGDIGIGEGPVISLAPDTSRTLSNYLIEILQQQNIPYQLHIKPHCTSTEAKCIQLSESTPETAVISIPIRYMHSPNEICKLNDIKALVLLLKIALLRQNNSCNNEK